MNPVANQESFAPFSHGAFAGGRSHQAEQTRAGSVSLNQSTDFTIITDEGDTVTLSTASSMAAHAGTYRSESYADGRTASSQSAFFQFSSSQSMAIEVHGDLNEAELEDIRKAVKAIGSMIDDFLAGDLKEMAKGGELLKELDTLHNLEAAFSYQRQVRYGRQEKVQISETAPERREHVHRHRGGHGRTQRLIDRIDRLTEAMTEKVVEFRGQRSRLVASIEDLFGRYRNGEVDAAPSDKLERDVVQAVETEFTKKIQMVNESASFNLTYTA